MRARMVDWSKYNGNTNLKEAVDAWGIVGLMARCTIGWSYHDSYYAHNFEQARNLGLLFGAYHVLRPDNRAPLKEADHFRKKMVVDGEIPDFLVDDLELPNSPDYWKMVTPKEVGEQIVVQLPAIRERTGRTVLVYSRSSWWNDPLTMGKVTPLGIESQYPLIEAEYPIQKPCGKLGWDIAPEAPRLPSPGKGWKPEDIVMWQWTSCLWPIGNGPDGIKVCDGDVLIPTYKEFLVLIGKAQPPASDKEKLDRLWEHHPELHSIM